jgi:hypothetical protein
MSEELQKKLAETKAKKHWTRDELAEDMKKYGHTPGKWKWFRSSPGQYGVECQTPRCGSHIVVFQNKNERTCKVLRAYVTKQCGEPPKLKRALPAPGTKTVH